MNLLVSSTNLSYGIHEHRYMWLILSTAGVAALCALFFVWLRHARGQQELERHSISPEALHSLRDSTQPVLIFDVRQPLDLLAYPRVIPGAVRVPPKSILQYPTLIPHEKDVVVYCTCPSDDTSRRILDRALGLGFHRIKFLKGGLEAWKVKGYPVEPYREAFHLFSPTQ